MGRTFPAAGGGFGALIGMALLVAGGGVLWADGSQRDRDGFLMAPSERFTTGSYALSSERIEFWVDSPGWLDARDLLGAVRLRSTSASEVFVGIAPAAAARAYLAGVGHDVVRDAADPGERARRAGGAPATPPAEAGIWTASTTGTGEQVLDWEVLEGEWTVVVMNADGARGVETRLRAGAQLSDLNWIGWAIAGAGVLLLAAAAGMLVAAIRRPPRAPGEPDAG
jgi:hypothetical protein